MRKRRFMCCLAIAAGWLLSVSSMPMHAADASESRLLTRRWQIEDGLPHNSANAVLQSPEGYLWIATYAGLARFDGRRFRVFGRDSNPRLPNDRITALAQNHSGNLLLGTETGEFYRFDGRQFERQSMPALWTTTKISAIALDDTNEVWLLDRHGTLISRRDQSIHPATKLGDPAWITKGFAKDRSSGVLWALQTGVLGRIENGRWKISNLPGPAADSPVQVIGSGRSGGIWAVASRHLWRWIDDGWRDSGPLGDWSSESLTALCEWEDGGLAIGSVESGLHLIRPGVSERHFGRSDRVGDNWIQSLTVDTEGALWVGTVMSGVSAMQRTNFDRIVPPEGFGSHPLKTITVRKAGGVWVGTEGGGVYRYADDKWQAFGSSMGLTSTFVWSVLEDRGGRLWVGTWGGGVFRMLADHFERVPGLEDPRELVAALFEARDGAMWIGTIHGLTRYAEGNITTYGVEQGIAQPEVRAIAEAPDRTIFFGLAGGGLGEVRAGRVRMFGEADGLTANYIVSLHFDDSGALWLGSMSGGLIRYKQGNFVQLGKEKGFPNGAVGNISEDAEKNFWLMSDRGVFRIPRSELDACADGLTPRLRYERFGNGDGLERIDIATGSQPAGCTTPDGLLWYPAMHGLVRVDPALQNPPAVLPRVILEEFAVDGDSLISSIDGSVAGPVIVPPGKDRFDFRYTAPTFAGAERIRFRYRLAGLDTRWSEGGEDRSASYHHLLPGRYTFEVIAAVSEWSEDSPKIALTFDLEPRWWERWFVRLAGYAGTAVAIASLVMWQQRRVHRRKTHQLEQQRSLERERTRIARDIHDDLGASLTRISLLSQSARRELDDPARSAERIDAIYATSRELTHKMDEIVWAVNPRHDSLDSVAHYLASFAQEMLALAGITCRLDIPLRLPNWPIFAEARHHLFLAFREALNNVVKHAEARCVTVTLGVDDVELWVRVEDDGRGFDPQPSTVSEMREGEGLANMRQRLADVGGRCDITQMAGSGMRVEFRVPMRPSDRTRTIS
ncbi:MAG: two-component regulator propeller domain-containing protein [Opitutaceae bacterium]